MYTQYTTPLWQRWLSVITALVMILGILPRAALQSARAATPPFSVKRLVEPELDGYTLDVNVAPVPEAGEVTKDPDQETYATGEVITLTATANVGWSFAGWSGYEDWPDTHIIKIDGDQAVVTIADENKVLTATFYPNLDVYVVGEGDVAANPDTKVPGHTPPPVRYEYAYNQVVTLTATPAANWLFAGWSGALTDNTIVATLTMTEPKTVTATFAIPPAAEDGEFTVPESLARPASTLAVRFTGDGIIAVGAPLTGTATPTPDGQAIVYTPTVETHPLPYTTHFTYTVRNNASMLEATAWVTVHVLPSADLSITQIMRGTISGLEFTLVARNLGPGPADGAVLSDTFPSTLSDITWACVSAGGAVCPHATGAGDIDETLATFPAHSVLTYTVSARTLAFVSGVNTATLTPPEGILDWALDNNSATYHIILYRLILPLVFRNHTP